MKKLTQYAKRQAKLTEEQKAEERRIRNAKDRARRANNQVAKQNKARTNYKSSAKRFILREATKIELKELEMLIQQRLKEI